MRFHASHWTDGGWLVGWLLVGGLVRTYGRVNVMMMCLCGYAVNHIVALAKQDTCYAMRQIIWLTTYGLSF